MTDQNPPKLIEPAPGQPGPSTGRPANQAAHPANPAVHDAAAVQQARPGAVPVTEAARDHALPPEHPHSGAVMGPTTVATGVPVTTVAQANPTLQRIGGVGAVGDTQPGTPPAGEAERAVDAERLASLPKRGTVPPTATAANGGVVIRQSVGDGKTRALFINTAFVESVEDDGESIQVTTSSGKVIELDPDESRAARHHLISNVV
jgi:hypothetical protein